MRFCNDPAAKTRRGSALPSCFFTATTLRVCATAFHVSVKRAHTFHVCETLSFRVSRKNKNQETKSEETDDYISPDRARERYDIASSRRLCKADKHNTKQKRRLAKRAAHLNRAAFTRRNPKTASMRNGHIRDSDMPVAIRSVYFPAPLKESYSNSSLLTLHGTGQG